MGNWNFDDIENSLVSDAEQRITRGYQCDGGQVPGCDGGQVPVTAQSSANVGDRYLSPVTTAAEPASQTSIIGLKGPDTKGVQTYLPLKDYMRLMQQKTLRKQNIAQIAGEAIIDWLDRQEQKPTK